MFKNSVRVHPSMLRCHLLLDQRPRYQFLFDNSKPQTLAPRIRNPEHQEPMARRSRHSTQLIRSIKKNKNRQESTQADQFTSDRAKNSPFVTGPVRELHYRPPGRPTLSPLSLWVVMASV
ncbi:hypothetical protein BHE74_00000918 [Ensete ventricosum]|uniref:Uncharacterized protein n=1 Tax=Ensete ventricosum TaxID=4639 RepID=A0A444EXQ6_ENSVE|nr:hypothetical protein GW17_00021055 [Ensete ventricosum]RWW89988.1 hypothetical protein BHE74_00000918 [Ensete ventricosum]RZR71424.1 hypothetical protein BHM03_00004990 [Ensete ventricosum]